MLAKDRGSWEENCAELQVVQREQLNKLPIPQNADIEHGLFEPNAGADEGCDWVQDEIAVVSRAVILRAKADSL